MPSKDPALLWYFNDWHGGTTTMSRFLKGCYMDVLYAQFNNGPLSLEEIKTVLGSDFGQAWPTLQKKFKFENGLYYNGRLKEERDKRVNYSDSRRKNRTTYVNHMENENEIRIENSVSYLDQIPEKDLAEFAAKYDIGRSGIEKKGKELFFWCGKKGRKYKNYRMALQDALLKDFGLRKKVFTPPVQVEEERRPIPEDLKKSMREIAGAMKV